MQAYGSTPTMKILTWAAWLRVHAVDPIWCPEVLTKQGYDLMRWHWQEWAPDDKHWQVPLIDTSGKKIKQIVDEVAKWIGSAQASTNLVLPVDQKDEDDLLSEDQT